MLWNGSKMVERKYGWTGKRLLVDLTRGVISYEKLDNAFLWTYLGGRGLNVHALYQLSPHDIHPLDPMAPLIFGTGPLTGTCVPCNGKGHNITAKSPLTGIIGDSNAGDDQVIILGKANELKYIWIDDDHVEIKSASHLQGLTTWETDTAIKTELGDDSIQIACIGPAGENLVKYASIMNNLTHAAGRTGLGAVMGAKNLKAVVIRGTKGVHVAHPTLLQALSNNLLEEISTAAGYKSRSTYGTSMIIDLYNSMGVLPTRNDQTGVFEGVEKISSEILLNNYVIKHRSCYACPIHCKLYYKVIEGQYSGISGEGPEFETLCALGARCGNDDLESILYMNSLADQYGIDTISLGNTIAWVMECYERKLLASRDVDHLNLTWGNTDSMKALIEKVVFRQGIGDLLAEGVRKAAQKLGRGTEQYALHVKGLEPPQQSVRGLKAWALGWAVSSRGADHLRAFPVAETTWTKQEAKHFFGTEKAADRFAYEGKAEMVKWFEDVSAIIDSLMLCKFGYLSLRAFDVKTIIQVIFATTGWQTNANDLMNIGERIINLERLYNMKVGMTPKEDTLPTRYLTEPLPSGPSKGEVVELEPMLTKYYELRGWNKELGRPTDAKLTSLGLTSLL
jgi:aldehyde:ferredoxin oxidoreductase